MRSIALFPVLLAAPPAAAQAVHYVDMLGACGRQTPWYPTILDAWNAASAADTIAVFPGLYPGVTRRGEQRPDRPERGVGQSRQGDLPLGPPGGRSRRQPGRANFVFASGDDGIFVDNPGAANPNTFRQNTSIRNAGCDLNDVSATPNVWGQNRAGSACGHAGGSAR